MTTTTTIDQIRSRIAELEATDRALVGSDTGTHGRPDAHSVYETIDGERYATYSFAGGNATRCTERQALDDTPGRIRYFSARPEEIRALAAELRALRRRVSSIV